MKAKHVEWLVKFLLISFLLVYVGVQVTRVLTPPMRTQTAHMDFVFQSVSGPGLVFRDEIPLEESGASVVSSLFDDAVRVLVGQPVAELLPPGTYIGNSALIRQTQWEIEMLLEAQDTSIHHIANTEALGRDIQQQLGIFAGLSASGNYHGAEDVRANLTALLNQRQIATGREQCFGARISQLTLEYERLNSFDRAGAIGVAYAPVSGFYARSTDGLESALSLNVARTAGLAELKAMIENTMPLQTVNRAGRVVTSHNWYVAVILDRYQTQWINTGQGLDIFFEGTGIRVPATVRRVLYRTGYDQAVLVLHSGHVSEDTINLRAQNVRLDFNVHEGIRVDAAALRFQNGERGVFTLSNNVVTFKRVDPIYEEPGFLLSRPPHNPRDPYTLRQYDQIIIGGVDLEDGRVLG